MPKDGVAEDVEHVVSVVGEGEGMYDGVEVNYEQGSYERDGCVPCWEYESPQRTEFGNWGWSEQIDDCCCSGLGEREGG